MKTISIPTLPRVTYRLLYGLDGRLALSEVCLGVLTSVTLIALAHEFPAFADVVRGWAAFNVGMHLIQ